jgi:hypothetical protein
MLAMSRIRFILLLLLCLAIPMVGWTSAWDGPSQTGHSASQMVPIQRDAGDQPTMHATVDQDDGDCDGDTCNDGRCKDKCPRGCSMATCASPCLGLTGLPMTFLWIAAYHAISPPIQHQLVAIRGSSPLRPPIS